MEKRTILVTGATGRQGGAVARHLLTSDWNVRALIRDISKPSARDLALRGAELFSGDLNDPLSVQQAMKGCYGVFSVQAVQETGTEAEIRQGKLLADLAGETEVVHFVYSSVGGAQRRSGVPFFESKWEIEAHIHRLGLDCTIFRPVFFFDNFNSPELRNSILRGILSLPLRPDRALQMIATNDIGAFVAMAFRDPGRFLGQAIQIAGDEMTMPAAAEIFTRVLGRAVRFVQMPIEQIEQQSPDIAIMYRWFNEHGYEADIRSLRNMYPPLLGLESWLKTTNWAPSLTAKVA